ncbi:MAG: hypothetical protein ACREPM_06945 [Gemmatimonadaceae bacterium]
MSTGLASLVRRTAADEVIVATQTYDHAARVRSYEIVANCGDASAPISRRGTS